MIFRLGNAGLTLDHAAERLVSRDAVQRGPEPSPRALNCAANRHAQSNAMQPEYGRLRLSPRDSLRVGL